MTKTGTILTLSAGLVAVVILSFYFGRQTGDSGTAGDALAEVNVPALSAGAEAGETLFNTNCAICHGMNAAGRNGSGPPLIHKIYEPNHHGDQAFYLAALRGVRQHHWSFGNMPPVDGVTEPDIAKIIVYVRELQRANGID